MKKQYLHAVQVCWKYVFGSRVQFKPFSLGWLRRIIFMRPVVFHVSTQIVLAALIFGCEEKSCNGLSSFCS